MPFVALGGLVVIVCVLAYAYGAVRLGDRVQVLSLARPVAAAGQVFTAADLAVVSAAADPRVPMLPASRVNTVLGRTAVVPLLAGMLLSPTAVGDAAFPPPGKLAASVSVKPGQYPHGLAPGARVLVYVTSTSTSAATGSTTSGSAPPHRLTATVLDVDLAGDGQGATVVTLLLDTSDSSVLASASAGGAVLMQTSPAGS